MNGILWAGPSPVDGAPIMAVLTGMDNSSANTKTGAMAQLWILRADIHPVDALKTGADFSICANCIHRPKELGENALKKFSRTCYVTVMSLCAIYKTYREGKYPTLDPQKTADALRGRALRIGAYGDPAMLPLELLEVITSQCASTGYTHRWRECDARYSLYCMASCDNPADVITATANGWRVFYADVNPANEIEGMKLATCPASKEAGKRTTCSQCLACGGNRIQPNEQRARHSLIKIALH